MALVDYLSPGDVEGRARDILDASAERTDHPGGALFDRALAHHAGVLDARNEYGTRLMDGGRLDRGIKEFVLVVVSEANRCEYCLDDHGSALVERFGGADEHEAVRAGEFDRLPERERAVAAFADQVARDPKRVSDDHLAALRRAGYDDAAVIELLAVAALAVSANAIVDALSIHPADRAGEPPDG